MAITLRGLVYDRYPSIRSFAKAAGWDRTKACKIVNGKREPRVTDLLDMSRALNTPVEKLASFFLQNESQNGDRKNNNPHKNPAP